MALSPITRRRFYNFRANRRGYISFWIFLALLLFTLFAEFIANDKPIVLSYDGDLHFPIFFEYAETEFGGDFETEADYRDPFVAELIEEKGWMVWPLIPYSYRTINYDLPVPAPAPPSGDNWLGTDDQGRDVLARVIYGFRLSVLFGLILTVFASIIGIAAAAVQGFFGGWIDLVFQRFIEVWSGLPQLFILIILSSIIEPNFWVLLVILLLFSWMALVGVVRAEFLRVRNFDYIRAARALGVGNIAIIFRHGLPNAMVSAVTFLPFILVGSITSLTSLDFWASACRPASPRWASCCARARRTCRRPGSAS